jgi:peptidoglycan/LPS O-acetylase OafA/YrhL
MNQKTLAGDRRRRKLITVLWALGLSVLVMVLIYLERSDVLYILCTLGVAALLIIVALADLGPREATGQQVVQPSPDSAKET